MTRINTSSRGVIYSLSAFLVIICQPAFATYPDARLCDHGNSLGCLRMAIRTQRSRSAKFASKTLEIAKAQPTHLNKILALATGAIVLGGSPKSDETLAKICEADRLPEACMIIAIREKDDTDVGKAKKAKHRKVLSELCAGGEGVACGYLATTNGNTEGSEDLISDLRKACTLNDFDSCLVIAGDALNKEKFEDSLILYQKVCDAHYPGGCRGVESVYEKENKSEKAAQFGKESM